MGQRNKRIRVVVADDSPRALRAICKYLEFDRRFEIVGIAPDGVRLVQQVKRWRPHLALVDLSMPQMNGLEAVRELRKVLPELRTLIFSELDGLSIREECVRGGADGFVKKSEMPEKLLEEIFRLFPGPFQAE